MDVRSSGRRVGGGYGSSSGGGDRRQGGGGYGSGSSQRRFTLPAVKDTVREMAETTATTALAAAAVRKASSSRGRDYNSGDRERSKVPRKNEETVCNNN